MKDHASRDTVDPLLSVCLSFAVPLWIERVKTWSPEERQAKAHAAGHMVAYGAGAAAVATSGKEKGKGKKRKKRPNQGAAEVFNAMACGLAILSYCPGGSTFAGQHWESRDG